MYFSPPIVLEQKSRPPNGFWRFATHRTKKRKVQNMRCLWLLSPT